MMSDTRLFHRSDPDFPTTRAVQQRLIDSGRLAGEGSLARSLTPSRSAAAKPSRTAPSPTAQGSPGLPVPDGPSISLGQMDRGTLHLDVNRLLAGRCLIQESSSVGKCATLRHLIEGAHDYLTLGATPGSLSMTSSGGRARR